MKRFVSENKTLLLLWILCGVALFIFCGHYSNILIDIGREVYYPQQIIEGNALYKDLYCINPPFAYLWNALLYKIFSPNLWVIYMSGIISSFAIVSGVYLISRKFLSEFLSLSVGLFTIVCGVCAPHLFNYTLPYNLGMLYGFVAVIYSLLALIKYETENKTQYFYLASLLAGLCVANRFEFLIYAIFLFIVSLLSKNKRVVLNFITCLIVFPMICALILFIQGVGISDYIKAFEDIRNVVISGSLTYFYSLQGIFFNPKVILMWIINFLKTGLCFIALVGGVKILDINKIFGWVVIVLSAVALYFITTSAVLMFMIPLLLLTGIVCFKDLRKRPEVFYFLIGVLTLCSKCFWVLLTLNYGNFVAPVVIIAFLAVIFTSIDVKYQKAFAIGLLVISAYYLLNFSVIRSSLNYKVSSNKGTIYTFAKNASTTSDVIGGLVASKAQTAVIYPEGMLINFLADVKSDTRYNSMTPLYIEALEEKNYVDIINNQKPDFVILTNQNMAEFGAEYVCDNYALTFCDALNEKYYAADDINDGFRYLIFGRK